MSQKPNIGFSGAARAKVGQVNAKFLSLAPKVTKLPPMHKYLLIVVVLISTSLIARLPAVSSAGSTSSSADIYGGDAGRHSVRQPSEWNQALGLQAPPALQADKLINYSVFGQTEGSNSSTSGGLSEQQSETLIGNKGRQQQQSNGTISDNNQDLGADLSGNQNGADKPSFGSLASRRRSTSLPGAMAPTSSRPGAARTRRKRSLDRRNSNPLGLLELNSILLQQHRQQALTPAEERHRSSRIAGIGGDELDDGDGDSNVASQRRKSESVAGVRSRRNRLQERKRNELEAKQLVDCNSLTIFWSFLKSLYPSLANHLLTLSMEQSDAGNPQQLFGRFSLNSKNILRLLEQAERLLKFEQQHQSQPASSGNPSQASAAIADWLARVASNPSYAKLLSRISQDQQITRQHESAAAPDRGQLSGSPSSSLLAAETTINSVATTADASTTTTTTTSPTIDSNNEVYGRITHYPHEFDDLYARNNHNEQSVLNKLHQLNHFIRSDKLPAGRPEGFSGAASDETGDDALESNRIPTTLNKEAATDSADGNFVYGNILRRPSFKPGDIRERQQQLQQRRLLQTSNQIKLDQYKNNNENNPLTSSANKENSYPAIQINTPASNKHEHQHQQQLRPQLSLQGPIKDDEETFAGQVSKQSTLNRLKQQRLINRTNQFNAAANDKQRQQREEEEQQQQTFQQDASGTDEFEGTFHSGPLSNVEVRQQLDQSKNNDKTGANIDGTAVLAHKTPDGRTVFNIGD